MRNCLGSDMGRTKEDLVAIVFKMPRQDAENLAQQLITDGYSIRRNTRDGLIVLPYWRKWAQAIARKTLICTLVDSQNKSR